MVNSEGNLSGGKSLYIVEKKISLHWVQDVWEICFVKAKMQRPGRLNRKVSHEQQQEFHLRASCFGGLIAPLSPHYSLLNQTVSCMAAIHTFWLRRNTDCWLARDVSWSVGRFVSYKMVQLCQRKVIAKNQRSQCFLKWIKQGNTCWRGQEPLIASFMQNCKAGIWAALATALVVQESYYPHFLLGAFDYYAIQIIA